MPVFISYSHQDSDFVNKLGMALVEKRIKVWLDKWELSVGDSLIQKIQEAISDSDLLCVVLSKSSVQSDWVRKELNSGLIRELEEKRVVILPVLIEECEIPLFLKEKKYADFRTSFSDGLEELIIPLEKAADPYDGRTISDEYYTDWGIHWGLYNQRHFFVRIEAVSVYKKYPFCILTEIMLIGNDALTAKQECFEQNGLGWFNIETMLTFLWETPHIRGARFLLEDNFPRDENFIIKDSKSELAIEINIHCNRLGENTGRNTLVDIEDLITKIKESRESRVPDWSQVDHNNLIKVIQECQQ